MLEDLKVEILKHPTEEDWILCKKCTLVTIGKDISTAPSEEWKRKILAARHSPIRTLEFCFKIENIPSYVATHLVRHVHATPFVKSQRNDRQDEYDRRKAPQDTPVDMCWFVNAEELMVIANKRLCHQASEETQYVIKIICDKVVELNPEFKDYLVPMCYYRGGKCTEFYPCGFNKTYNKEIK